MSETVNHPAHYNTGWIEVIDAIEDWELGFHAGNVVKYVARYKHKNGINDLQKAMWYLQRLIRNTEQEIANDDAVQEHSGRESDPVDGGRSHGRSKRKGKHKRA